MCVCVRACVRACVWLTGLFFGWFNSISTFFVIYTEVSLFCM